MLAVLDLDKTVIIEVNISDYTIEEVLLIEDKGGQWRLVVYLLKFLNKTEKNYKIYDKEMLEG